MRKEREKRNKIIIGLISLLFLMTVGYAAFQTNLTIKGTSKISSNWNIKITEINSKDIVGSASNIEEPVFQDLSATFKTGLVLPGDSMSYDITITNAGNLNAKLDKITLSDPNHPAIKFTSNGLTEGDVLNAGRTAQLTVKVEYLSTITEQPADSTASLTVDLEYSQIEGSNIVPDNSYFITYDCATNGGNDCREYNTSFVEGENVNLNVSGNKTDWVFVGWNTDKDAKVGFKEYLMPKQDTTLYALYLPKDSTPPIIDNVSTTKTTKSITAIVSAHDDESDILKYEFSKDDGKTWVDNGDNNTYTFAGLAQETNYPIKVKVTNRVFGTSESELSVTTSTLEKPTFKEQNEYDEKIIPTKITTTTTEAYQWSNTDGVWKSGNYNVHNTTSELTFNFTLTEARTLSFDWSVSSESVNYDYVYYTIIKDGSTVSGTGTTNKIGGTSYGSAENSLNYLSVSKDLEPGTYKVTFTYRKDGSGHTGLDRAYVKNFDVRSAKTPTPVNRSININYPSGCDGELICSYSKNGGEFIKATDNTTVPFIESGNLVAKVTDGISTVTNSYQVSISKPEDLKQDTVTTGDGLYPDSTEDGRYVYKGSNPNNYLNFNNEFAGWRILSVEADGSMKIIKEENLGNNVYDTGGSRYSTVEYCNNSSYGCNIWGNELTTKDSANNSLDSLAYSLGSTAYKLPTKEATLNTYLNSEYYAAIDKSSRIHIMPNSFNIGVVSNASNYTLVQNKEQAKAAKWKGNIGLIDINDFVSASSTSSCTSVNTSCNTNNYLIKSAYNWWTMSPFTGYPYRNFYITTSGAMSYANSSTSYAIRPVTHLKPSIRLVGSGTKKDPYEIITLPVPTFNETATDTGKKLTINYPDQCGDKFKCSYISEGKEVNVTATTINLDFEQEGTYNIVAKIFDDVETNSVSYSIKVNSKTVNDLLPNVVTTGDGLYKDTTENGRYVYKGTNPNNYVSYNNELWRILAIESDDTLKIVRNDLEAAQAYDTSTNRYNSATYCSNASYGCNIWGSTKNITNINDKPVSKMAYSLSSTTYNLPETVSTLNTYLNDSYYLTLTEEARMELAPNDFNIGVVSNTNSYTINQNSEQEKANKWKGNIGLINVTDFVKASTYSSCTNVYSSYSYSYCANNNYLRNSSYNWWTLTPFSGVQYRNYYITSSGTISYANSTNSYNIRPVVYLSPNVKIKSGTGTKTDPYILSVIPRATFTETKTTPNKVTITFPEECGSQYTCSYSKNGGTKVTVTTTTIEMTFDEVGYIIAEVKEGNDKVTSSHTVNLYQTPDSFDEYICPASYVESGEGASKTCTLTEVKDRYYSSGYYSCPSGYRLSGSTCSKTDTVNLSGTATCSNGSIVPNSGSDLQGPYKAQGYSCSGSGCTCPSSGNGTATCPATCSKTFSQSATYHSGYYYCPSGFSSVTIDGVSKCQKITTQNATLKTTYTCPADYRLQDKICIKD